LGSCRVTKRSLDRGIASVVPRPGAPPLGHRARSLRARGAESAREWHRCRAASISALALSASGVSWIDQLQLTGAASVTAARPRDRELWPVRPRALASLLTCTGLSERSVELVASGQSDRARSVCACRRALSVAAWRRSGDVDGAERIGIAAQPPSLPLPTGQAGPYRWRCGTASRSYGLASRTRLNGVSVARRTRVNPPSLSTSVSLASPACAPSARPTS
jgi:hypothetical protein